MLTTNRKLATWAPHRRARVIASTAAMLIAGVASAADAATQRSPASACFTETANDDDYLYLDGIGNNSSGLGWRPRRVHCPVTDGPAHPRTGIRAGNLMGFDANTQAGSHHDFQVRGCVTDVGGGRRGHAAICSRTHAYNQGVYRPNTFDAPLPADIIAFLRMTLRFSVANLVVQIPAHNGTPSIFYGFKLGW